MLLSVTGASGTGKSTALESLSRVDLGRPVTCVEFDSIGVPEGADTSWRHGAIEHWVRFAIDAQDRGEHVLLFGQVPPGELLAAPSADRLDGIAICVLHCSPEVQERRLIDRGEPADSLVHHLRFGEWIRHHAVDSSHEPEVIRTESDVPMQWSRWERLSGDDPRWPVSLIDVDALSRVAVTERIERWARDVLVGGVSAGVRKP
ncbi:AAA family ATPase [Microbacterium sp. KUDC0406]|uniref:AAA family ATPase n=1 Tax=Microbacterium sp. KUDC0406 TaxID=2909588 RepID=UPI001F3BD61A|nr:AAA family ATPase [Microbacterium sp. KUDC0406]UJP09745.1 AAA family ATPase [Microbacterium sp. KUDC0406]